MNAIVDEDGVLLRRIDYDVFGAERATGWDSGINNANASSNRMKFSGAVGHVGEPDAGLTYMRARYYDPSLGRFISEDPAQSGTNWYAYCGNNPVNAVDPSGERAIGPAMLAKFLLNAAYHLAKAWGWEPSKKVEHLKLSFDLACDSIAAGSMFAMGVAWAGTYESGGVLGPLAVAAGAVIGTTVVTVLAVESLRQLTMAIILDSGP